MTDNYYAPTAYNSEHIPQDMPPQTHLAGKLPVFMRLPWGGGKDDEFEQNLFLDYPPKLLRKYQGSKLSYSLLNDERFGAFTHQYLRPSSFEGSSSFWRQLYATGLLGVPLSVIIMIVMLIMSPILNITHLASDIPFFILKYFTLPAVCCLILGYIIVNYIPFLSRRHGLGSPWELNRQTGMVTNYTYSRKDPGNPISADSVPFYECDGYLWTAPSRYGITHSLVLGHRYSDRKFYIGEIIGRVGVPSSVYKYWDFIQNYMDTSKPLPDIPILEQFRPLDPVTAAYDQKTGRDPHYFLNMDNATWRKVKKTLANGATTIDGRRCLMQRNRVVYFEGHTWGANYVEPDLEDYKRFLAEKAQREQQQNNK